MEAGAHHLQAASLLAEDQEAQVRKAPIPAATAATTQVMIMAETAVQAAIGTLGFTRSVQARR